MNDKGDAVVGGFAWAAYDLENIDKSGEMRWNMQRHPSYTLEDDIYQFGILAVEVQCMRM